jgi:hypothetical protein
MTAYLTTRKMDSPDAYFDRDVVDRAITDEVKPLIL